MHDVGLHTSPHQHAARVAFNLLPVYILPVLTHARHWITNAAAPAHVLFNLLLIDIPTFPYVQNVADHVFQSSHALMVWHWVTTFRVTHVLSSSLRIYSRHTMTYDGLRVGNVLWVRS